MDPVRRRYLVVTIVLISLAVAGGLAVMVIQIRQQGVLRALGDASLAFAVAIGMGGTLLRRRR